VNNDSKLTEYCEGCVVEDCRFKDLPDHFEVNCPADPGPYGYNGRRAPRNERPIETEGSHQRRQK
jgi:hypothetical protein